MSERESGYERIEADHYATPAWVPEALISVERFREPIWECAPGEGHMVRALQARSLVVGYLPDADFLTCKAPRPLGSIITNPPYKLADEFVEHALTYCVKVAMLLPIAWDSAKSRAKFFRNCPQFKAKYTLTKRIRWENIEQKDSGPSMNHAWFVWSFENEGPPTLGWLP